MPTIVLETHINAPAEKCFDLMRDPRIHTGNRWQTNKRSSVGISNGEFGLGQSVVFAQTFFGMRQKLTVEVVEFERPNRFVDEMVDGWFESFTHIHEFTDFGGGTKMLDITIWTSPFGIIGRIIDSLLLKRHLKNVVTVRNARIKMIAEHQTD